MQGMLRQPSWRVCCAAEDVASPLDASADASAASCAVSPAAEAGLDDAVL